MKKIRFIQILGVIFCILLITVGFCAAFSMSSGVSSTSSSGGFSSSSSSSNLGFSTSTLVMTGGTPSKPATSPLLPEGLGYPTE